MTFRIFVCPATNKQYAFEGIHCHRSMFKMCHFSRSAALSFESSLPLQWNDVAILTLEDDVSYSSTIQPICLATGDNSYVNSRVTVAGWGTLTEGGQQPASLMKVS
jgi:hypothetical protein